MDTSTMKKTKQARRFVVDRREEHRGLLECLGCEEQALRIRQEIAAENFQEGNFEEIKPIPLSFRCSYKDYEDDDDLVLASVFASVAARLLTAQQRESLNSVKIFAGELVRFDFDNYFVHPHGYMDILWGSLEELSIDIPYSVALKLSELQEDNVFEEIIVFGPKEIWEEHIAIDPIVCGRIGERLFWICEWEPGKNESK